jgi:hypothetical protein
MLVGAYHFARPDLGNNAADEARWFVSVAGNYIKPGYLRPALDIEKSAKKPEDDLSKWIDEWMETVKRETGVEPMIYTSASFATDNRLDASLARYNLWVAHWTYDTGRSPATGFWDGWDFWQYSNKGEVPGISGDVDLDLFIGSEEELSNYVITAGYLSPVEVKSPQKVTLTHYVHEGKADGPVLTGADVTGQDAAGSSFSQTIGANGCVVITGSPGSWQFVATKHEYAVNSWSQEITETCTKHAFLFLKESTIRGIIGKWSWFNGHTVVVHPDGTLECMDATGTWEITDPSSNTYTFHWLADTYVDQLNLSQDGRNLNGYNQYGTHVTGLKTESSNQEDIPSAAIGRWSWFNGHTVVVHPDGALECIDNTGTWELTDPSSGTYTLRWQVGGYIDQLTLSQDGRSLNGNNNLYGTRITAD